MRINRTITGLTLAALVVFSITACSSVKTDADIIKAIENTVANCKIEKRYGWAKECANNEGQKLKDLVKAKGQAASLGTLATMLGNEKEEIRAVAADRLYDNFRSLGDLKKNPELIDEAAVDLLIENLGKYHEYGSLYAARSATQLAMLTGKQDALYAAIDKHPQDTTKSEAYQNLMVYGGLTGFEKAKALVASGDDLMAAAGSNAPRKKGIYTAEELKEVCEWAAPLLQNKNDRVAGNAAQILISKCKGEYIGKVFDEAEKRASEDRLKYPFAGALKSFTFSCKSYAGSTPAGSPEQCKRNEALLGKIK